MPSSGSLKNTLMVVLISVILTGIVLPSGEGHTYNEEEIPDDHYFKIWINTREGDTMYYSVSVTEGSRVDVYYLNESESQRYIDGKSFTPSREHIGAKKVTGEFQIPDDEDYMFVIDNMDNAQANDTRPSGDIIVDAEIVSSWVISEKSEPTLFRMMMIPFMFLALGILAMQGDKIRRRKIREQRKRQFLTGVRGGPFLPTRNTSSETASQKSEPPRPQSLKEKISRGNP